MESGRVKPPCVRVSAGWERGAGCSALRQSLLRFLPGRRRAVLGPGASSVRLVPWAARLSPDDLDTAERGASWRCCLSLEECQLSWSPVPRGWAFRPPPGAAPVECCREDSLTPRSLCPALPAVSQCLVLQAACLLKGVLLSHSTSFCHPLCHCLEGLGQCLRGLEALNPNVPMSAHPSSLGSS